MSAEKKIKTEAKSIMSGSWTKIICTCFFTLMLVLLFDNIATPLGLLMNYISEFFSQSNPVYLEIIYRTIYVLCIIIPFILIIFFSPIFNGLSRFFYSSIHTKTFDMNDTIYYFRKGVYFKTIKLNLAFVVRLIPPAIISSIPVIIYACLCAFVFKDFFHTDLYYTFFGILAFFSSIIFFIYSLKYFLVLRYYEEDEELKINEYFKLSKNTMADNTLNVIKLLLSFIPWILLCVLVLPLFYVLPYMEESLSLSAKYMISLENEKEKNNESFSMYDSVQ